MSPASSAPKMVAANRQAKAFWLMSMRTSAAASPPSPPSVATMSSPWSSDWEVSLTSKPIASGSPLISTSSYTPYPERLSPCGSMTHTAESPAA